MAYPALCWLQLGSHVKLATSYSTLPCISATYTTNNNILSSPLTQNLMKHFQTSVSRLVACGAKERISTKSSTGIKFYSLFIKFHNQDLFRISPLVGVFTIEWILNSQVFWDSTPCRPLKWLPSFGRWNALPERQDLLTMNTSNSQGWSLLTFCMKSSCINRAR